MPELQNPSETPGFNPEAETIDESMEMRPDLGQEHRKAVGAAPEASAEQSVTPREQIHGQVIEASPAKQETRPGEAARVENPLYDLQGLEIAIRHRAGNPNLDVGGSTEVQEWKIERDRQKGIT